MNVINYPDVRNKFNQGFDRTIPVNEIVLHGTGGGSNAQSILKWMMSGERGDEYKKGIALFHALVDTNGDIYQIIDTNKWVYHSSSGAHDKETIGIECLNTTSGNTGDINEEQYSALLEYIQMLLNKYLITRIVGHDFNDLKYSKKTKGCPGPKFQWDKIKSYLTDNGYTFDWANLEISNIKKEA